MSIVGGRATRQRARRDDTHGLLVELAVWYSMVNTACVNLPVVMPGDK